MSIHVYFVFPHLFSTACGKRRPLFKVVRSLKSGRLLPQAIFYLFELGYEMYGKSQFSKIAYLFLDISPPKTINPQISLINISVIDCSSASSYATRRQSSEVNRAQLLGDHSNYLIIQLKMDSNIKKELTDQLNQLKVEDDE